MKKYGPGLVISNYNLGILFMLAVSSLATYGILLAGWAANSKYSFLGSKWPVKDFNLSMQQTISGKFMYNLLGTLKKGIVFTSAFTVPLFRYYGSESKAKQLENKIYPYYVTGLSDVEASFILSIYKKKDSKTGWQVQPVFAIHMHIKDIDLLKSIQSFFGVGVLVSSKTTNSARYSVNSLKDLINIIIPHFDKYPLLTQKRADFFLFKSAVLLIEQKKHLTVGGLHEIVNIRASMNKGLTKVLADNFPYTMPVAKPLVEVSEFIDSYWLLGFMEGESCFFVGVTNNRLTNTKFSVNLLFKLTQHSRDIELLRNIAKFLDCGFIQESTQIVNLLCKKFSDIEEKIIPFFDKYPLLGSKRLDYADFYKVFKLMKNKSHLTLKGLNEIQIIKAGMNRGRDYNGEVDAHSVSYSEPPTLRVSCSLCASKVKTLLNMDNPQVTKAFNYSQVGTSEAIRLLSIDTKLRGRPPVYGGSHHNFKRDEKWNQLTKKGYASLEITMDLRDEHALQIVKNVYGGSIKLVSGANALRYCLRHKAGFLALVNDVNGLIRSSNRLVQLNKICDKYELDLIYPSKLNYDNGWLAGFFDADGSISINTTNGQLSISIAQKTAEMLYPLVELYGGTIYINKSGLSFKWYITKLEDILNIVEYFKKYPARSAKKNRLHLIPKCYELKDLKAHKALPGTLLNKSWQYFIQKWKKYED